MWGWVGWEGQCGCEIEDIVKMKKKSRGRSGQGCGRGFRVDVNEGLKLM